MNGDGASLKEILLDLYDSEINISIVSFWDDGYTVKLGDELNGFRGEFNVNEDIIYLPEMIKVKAIELYPNSEFAKKYKEAEDEKDT